MAPETRQPARVATFVLMALAYLAVEIAAHPDGRPRPFGVGMGMALLALAILGHAWIPRPQGRSKPPAGVIAFLAVVLVLPMAMEPLVRSMTGHGLPLEMQMVNGLRALGLGLAAASAWPLCLRLAGVVALFLALFASAMGDQPQIPYALGALAAAGGVWLVLVYRDTLAHAEVASAATGAVVERVPLRLPYREMMVFGVLALLIVAATWAGPKRVMLSLGEWVPTSGGTGDQDPFARYGTNDGPEEISGDNARSAGMVDSERLIEDNKDSLIDAVNDMYGPPHKPPKTIEKMVAAGKVEIIQNHDRLPDNRRPSRDFGTSREGPKSARKPESQGPRGLIEIEGRTPLHIRLMIYDRYDAEAGYWRQAPQPNTLMLDSVGGDWMERLNLGLADWYSADDHHRLKIADPKDALVPTPPLMTRFRVPRVDRPDYYTWEYDSVLALSGRSRSPPGMIVQTVCRTIAPERLPEAAFNNTSRGGVNMVFTQVPESLASEMGRLAEDWAGEQPRGWPQIAAVLEHLRADFTLDAQASAPADHPAPVLWFLNESRRGPDYLFATSAALMLRSLGYSTRVALGYYASPSAYDFETGHTPVRATDVHVWPEVILRDNQWLVIEPTPGYAVLPPLQPWREWLLERLVALGSWMRERAVSLSIMAIAVAWLIHWRLIVLDAIRTLAWQLAPGRTWRLRILRTLRLIEARAGWVGRARPASETVTSWAERLAGPDRSLPELARLSDWAAYAPDGPAPWSRDEIKCICRRAVHHWNLQRWQAAGNKEMG